VTDILVISVTVADLLLHTKSLSSYSQPVPTAHVEKTRHTPLRSAIMIPCTHACQAPFPTPRFRFPKVRSPSHFLRADLTISGFNSLNWH